MFTNTLLGFQWRLARGFEQGEGVYHNPAKQGLGNACRSSAQSPTLLTCMLMPQPYSYNTPRCNLLNSPIRMQGLLFCNASS